MTPLIDNIQKFYESHKAELLVWYPGLRLRRVTEEAKYYIELRTRVAAQEKDFVSKRYLNDFFEELNKGIPLEYINSRKFFYNNYFFVNSHVLIPRSETEVLVDFVAKHLSKVNEKLTIVDIGTGSGNILLTLAQELNRPHKFIGLDICEQALKVAKKNFFKLGFSFSKKHAIDFKISDKLSAIDEQIDVIISNPPYYMKKKDDHFIHKQVRVFEPALAISIEDGAFVDWYNDFFLQCYAKLTKGGSLFLETDQGHMKFIEKTAVEIGFVTQKKFKDLVGHERFIWLIKK